MDEPKKRHPIPLWVALLFLVSFLGLILAAGLEIEGLWRAHRERIEAQVWPSVSATVLGCNLDPYYPFTGDGGGVNYDVRCRFSYVVNSVPFQSSVSLPGKHHAIQYPAELPPNAIHMKAWANQHKKGSQFTIHWKLTTVSVS